jgi:CubicO group peptidase (beta-lactamase class C family)
MRRSDAASLTALVWMFSALVPCFAQNADAPEERFDKLVRAETSSGDSVGTAVAVVYQGRVVYLKAFGMANVETKQPLSVDCVWRSGSVARVYSSMVIASLAREGVLPLDKPVGSYWPELNRQLGKASVRELLENRGGVKDEHVDYPLWQVGNLRKYALGFDASSIVAEPGFIWSFSSPSGNLAAAVAEQVSGKDFAELLESRVFQPMEFTRTSLSILRIATQPIAQGHHKGTAGWEVVRPLAMNIVGWPGNSIFTSVAEGITFLGTLAEEGRWNGRQVFPKAAVADTLSFVKSGRDVGAVMREATSWGGVATTFVLIPDQRFGLILFTNGGLSRTSTDSIISGAQQIWLGASAAPASRPAPTGHSVPVTEEQAKELAGLYRNEYLIRLEWKDGNLMFRDEGTSYRKPSDWIVVRRVSENRYVLGQSLLYGADVSVVRSAAGTVSHIVYGSRAFLKDR